MLVHPKVSHPCWLPLFADRTHLGFQRRYILIKFRGRIVLIKVLGDDLGNFLKLEKMSLNRYKFDVRYIWRLTKKYIFLFFISRFFLRLCMYREKSRRNNTSNFSGSKSLFIFVNLDLNSFVEFIVYSHFDNIGFIKLRRNSSQPEVSECRLLTIGFNLSCYEAYSKIKTTHIIIATVRVFRRIRFSRIL